MAAPTDDAHGNGDPNNKIFTDEDEEDDMADLFSFGSGEAGDGAANASASPAPPGLTDPSSSTALGAAAGDNEGEAPGRDRLASDDSFLELLESEGSAMNLLLANTTSSPHSPRAAGTTPTQHPNNSSLSRIVDEETQEILSWLENEGKEKQQEDGAQRRVEASAPSRAPPALPSLDHAPPLPQTHHLAVTAASSGSAAVPVPVPTVVALPPRFSTLKEALSSDESTPQQIRKLAADQPEQLESLSNEHRAQLYCKLLCSGKSLQQVQQSSLADSFVEHKSSSGDSWPYPVEDVAARVVAFRPDDRSLETTVEDLQQLLSFYFSQKGSDEDVLIPPIAAVVLAVTPPTAVAASAVLLPQLVATCMPILALQPAERWEAALHLHQELYLLACYHVPLLVYHLDRHLPGWFWPQSPTPVGAMLEARDRSPTAKTAKTLQARGRLPLSWLLSHMAGECGGTGTTSASSASSSLGLELQALLRLWDQTLLVVEHASAMRFFLVLAVLEREADDLLLLTGDDLQARLQKVLQLRDPPPNWWARARQLQEWTPESVWMKLVAAEDRAVQQSLQKRQERAQLEMQAKLDAEAEAHRIAQEQKAAAARERLTRARLVAFYRKHAPDKEANIDQIMVTYAGEWESLDAKLKLKYGEGFNPPASKKPPQPPGSASSPFTSKKTNKLLSTMNTGLGVRRESDRSLQPGNDEEGGDGSMGDVGDDGSPPSEQVSVLVAASEVLPVICWSKEAAAARGQQRRRRLTDKKQLKFFLVDSRSEEAASDQGRFPTAVNLSPEAMLDPERLKDNEDMLESLRGAVHIVVMGEGFAALPFLYDHKLTPKLEELMHEDESRTNICALFFVKKGFPFVSVLNGGFAAAHSWLVRNGKSHHLNPSEVLVDYDPEASLFGQLEYLHNASATEKAQRRMQSLLDKSLLAMARRAQQLEKLAADLEGKEDDPPPQVSRNLFGRAEPSALEVAVEAPPKTPDKKGFSNPFAGVAKSFSASASDTAGSRDDATSTAFASDVTRPHIVFPPTPDSTDDENKAEGSDLGGAGAQNRSGTLRGSGGDEAPTNSGSPAATTAAQQASSMFKGLGAVINQSIKNTDVSGAGNVLKRNPFARFGGGGGGGGGGSVTPVSAGASGAASGAAVPSAPNSGGWNSLRKAAMARMRSNDGPAPHDEESISFGSLDTGSSEGQASAPTPAAQVQQV